MTTSDVGPRTFKAGKGTITIWSPDSAEAKELAALTAEHDANERKLSAIRADALREHYEEFVIVSDWGKNVRYYPSWEALPPMQSRLRRAKQRHTTTSWSGPKNLIV